MACHIALYGADIEIQNHCLIETHLISEIHWKLGNCITVRPTAFELLLCL